MGKTASIDIDDRELKRFNRVLSKSGTPKATSRAINETLKWANSQTVKKTAKAIKIPQKYLKSRFSVKGDRKGKRMILTESNAKTLSGKLTVYTRGLPVALIAGKQTKSKGGGVKATGGRFYKGAFKAKGMVFKRKGRARLPLVVPRVPLSKALQHGFDKRITGTEGRAEYTKRWNRLMQLEINRAAKRASRGG